MASIDAGLSMMNDGMMVEGVIKDDNNTLLIVQSSVISPPQ